MTYEHGNCCLFVVQSFERGARDSDGGKDCERSVGVGDFRTGHGCI